MSMSVSGNNATVANRRPSLGASTIGLKFVMGITGLGLSGFVLIHMLGNLALFISAEAYNKYSHALIKNPLLPVAEMGLITFFLIHFYCAISLTLRNRAARPQRYAMATNGAKAVTNASKTMAATGTVLLTFIIYHIVTFKFGPHYDTVYNGVVMRDLQRLIVEVFQSPIYVGFYVVSLLVLGHHLSHGVQSSLQSLGLNHPQYTPAIKKIGFGFALLVAIGFISQPLYVFLYLNR
jgi:succinate dehydrogenase / fumarate reductase cytochrome b subunit